MKRIFIILALIPMLTACDPATVQKVLDTASGLADTPLTQEQIGQGLKQALEIGISEGAAKLSQEDGYFKSPYKILLPEEARKVTDKLQNIPGFSQVEDVILEKINRGAEDAAKKATPIFVDAIKQMSFKDATNILMGGQKDAATQYLNQATYDKLYAEFTPVIIASLDKFNARKYWGDAVDKYNKIPLVQDVNPSLEDYVTKQALMGLFSMVEKKELDIRENVAARTTDLLKKVFAKQDS
ncbi:MAG: DUF4197 domain-containing protein [Bacteroidota bacterium]